MAESQIPLIDISEISLIHVDVANKKYASIGEKLRDAFGSWGFAYLSNHGIPDKIVEECMREAKKFFELPLAEKKTFNRDVTNPHGYSSMGREILEEDAIEAKESFDFRSFDKYSNYPDDQVPNLRPSVMHLAHQSIILARRLIRSLGEDLNTDALKFLDSHSKMFGQGNSSSLRILHYPPIPDDQDEQCSCDNPKKITRCGVHTDYGGLTMLFQDQLGGLEVQHINGTWVPATPIPGTIVVNIGDLLQFWTAGRYRATPHRVLVDSKTKSQSRMSIALFIHPNHDTKILPIRPDNNEDDAENEDTRTALEHIDSRFRETYKS